MTTKQRNAIERADQTLHAQLGRLRMVVTSLNAIQRLVGAYEIGTDISEIEHPLLQLMKANEKEIAGVANAIDQQLIDLSKAGVR